VIYFSIVIPAAASLDPIWKQTQTAELGFFWGEKSLLKVGLLFVSKCPVLYNTFTLY
jgi:hypothetical protein